MASTGDGDAEPLMANAELRALFSAAVDALVMIDERGSILAFGAAAERLFGYSLAEVIGKPVDMLMPEPHRTNHASYMSRYLETGDAKIIGIGRELEAQRASGEIFPISLTVGEAQSDGERRFVGIIRDLTTERDAEKRTRALEARLAQVGRSNLMGEMATGIAHEINQPLSAIATYAQAAQRLLERDSKNAAASEVCKKIEEQAHRAAQVIRNIRQFIRQQEVIPETLDVNRVIADVWELIEADTRAQGLRGVVRYAEGLPAIRADALQLQQVLVNLTHNAVDAMSDGLQSDGAIVVETSRGPDEAVCISVTDRGPGVSESLGDNIFHPFVTTKTGGIGVGLAISRSIVQAYGGRLTFRDNPDGGAIFTISLPAAKDGAET